MISLVRYFSILILCLLNFNTIYAFEKLYNFENLELNPEKDILFLDLDHTLMEPISYEGSDPWFRSLMAAAHPENREFVIELYNTIQHKTDVRLTDQALAELWIKWTTQRIPMIGLTARSLALAETTHRQLQGLGINFLYEDNYHVAHPDFDIKDHIIFTAGSPKGLVLKRILLQHPELLDKRIVFIDDSLHNLESVDNDLKNLGVRYDLYHYDESSKRYHQASCVRPAMF
jgi:hypothetical protein